MNKLQVRIVRLEAVLGKLKTNIAETKKVSIVKFKEFDLYKLALNTVAT